MCEVVPKGSWREVLRRTSSTMRDIPGADLGMGSDGFGLALDGTLNFGGIQNPAQQWGDLCAHPDGCNCMVSGQRYNQSLDELEFARSACAAAQSGDVQKLARIISRNPEAVHTDGSKGRVAACIKT